MKLSFGEAQALREIFVGSDPTLKTALTAFFADESENAAEQCKRMMLSIPPSSEQAAQYAAQSMAFDTAMGRLEAYMQEQWEAQ